MQKVAVFVNDVEHARGVLQPLLQADEPTHWIVVACVPTLTRHIGRWVSNDARRQRAERWGDDLFAELEPALRLHAGSRVERVLVQRQVFDAVAPRQAGRAARGTRPAAALATRPPARRDDRDRLPAGLRGLTRAA